MNEIRVIVYITLAVFAWLAGLWLILRVPF
jgi:hypothetical protein